MKVVPCKNTFISWARNPGLHSSLLATQNCTYISSPCVMCVCFVCTCTLWHNGINFPLTDKAEKFWCFLSRLLYLCLYFIPYKFICCYPGKFLSHILHHQAFVILSILSSLSSSANNAGSSDFLCSRRAPDYPSTHPSSRLRVWRRPYAPPVLQKHAHQCYCRSQLHTYSLDNRR